MDMHIETPTIAPTRRRSTTGRVLSPQAMIQMHMDKHKDKEAAIAAVIDAADHNATLQVFLINKGARAAVGELVRSDNSKIFTGNPAANVTAPLRMTEAPLVSAAHKSRLRKAADATLKLLGVLLPNGVRMSEARYDDLLHAVNHYEPQARDMWQKANYYKSVMRELPKGKSVAEAMDDAALTDLYRKAEFTA